MCGIVGMALRNKGVDEEVVGAMVQRLRHRGPDDSGVWRNAASNVGLGHVRLSIIDLSPAGHQPMQDGSGRLWLTFNGEIYNFQSLRRELEQQGYQFRTNTDSEVILHGYRHWGENCVQRFNGMFAFCIYDEERQRLFFARDRVGKKPLYYHLWADGIAFASEAKAILPVRAGKWELDAGAVNAYFAYGYIPGSQSIFRDILRLPAASTMTYDLQSGQHSIKAYWSLPEPKQFNGAPPDREALLAEMEELLLDCVRLRLIADVPLGVLLSGGVDSSLITAAAARLSSSPIKTFTITFPGGGQYDEAPYAQLVASHFGTEHCVLPLPAADLSVLRTVAAHLDEPLGDPSILPTYLVSELTRQHVTVALGGDGGDELFGGYAWYRRGLNAMQRVRAAPRWLRRAAAAGVQALPPGTRGRNYISATADDLRHFMITNSLVFDAGMRRQLFAEPLRQALNGALQGPEGYKQKIWAATADDFYAMSTLDVRTFMQDDILVKVDRASMAFALEVRAPWLDVRMVEFAMRETPSVYKVDDASDRILQRELARRMLPAELDLQRKQGFVMPIHTWMAGAWGDETLQVVTDGEARAWLNRDYIAGLLQGQQQGRSNGVRLFTCLMFGLWLDSLQRN